MKTLLFQPVNLTSVYQPNVRWPGPGAPNPSKIAQWVPQTDWYIACAKLGFLDAFFVENATLNRANWWAASTGVPKPGAVPPVPYVGMPDEQNSLPPNIAAAKSCAGLALNPSRFGYAVPPRPPLIFDIEDDGTGAWASTLYAGMDATPVQRRNAAQLTLGAIRAVKQIDAQIPVGWYGAPYAADRPITDEASQEAWRDAFAAQAEVAEEVDMSVYDLYVWDDVIENPAVAFDEAARVKGAHERFFPGLVDKRMVLISPVLFPNLNGTMAAKSGQVMALSDWHRLVDYLIGVDRPWAICLWPAGIVDPVMGHIEYLAKAAG